MAETQLSCSFCGADKRDVDKLVAGPKVYICDGCIRRAEAALADGRITEPGGRGVTCAFCSLTVEEVDIVPGPQVHQRFLAPEVDEVLANRILASTDLPEAGWPDEILNLRRALQAMDGVEKLTIKPQISIALALSEDADIQATSAEVESLLASTLDGFRVQFFEAATKTIATYPAICSGCIELCASILDGDSH